MREENPNSGKKEATILFYWGNTMKKYARKVISITMAILMIVSLLPALGGMAVAANVQSTESNTGVNLAAFAGQTNIARGIAPHNAIVTVPHANGGPPSNIINGTNVANSTAANSFNTWGATPGTATNRYFVTMSFPEPVLISGTSVLWWVFTDNGVQYPVNAYVEYSTDPYVGTLTQQTSTGSGHSAQATALAALNWTRLDSIGTAFTPGALPNLGSSGWIRNTLWNNLILEVPVMALHVRLSIQANKTSGTAPGVGINCWNIYGAAAPIEDDEQKVDLALAALGIGDSLEITQNLTLPATGLHGTTISWSSSNTDNLWHNGMVIRPPSGADAAAALTATVTAGEVSKTKTFNVTIPAFPSGFGRAIANVKDAPDGEDLSAAYVIDVPRGTAPKLPYRVWVEYTDGYAEWRNTMWPWQAASNPASGPPAIAGWTPSNVENTWKGYATDREYTVSGWILGDGATAYGYPITVGCVVVEADIALPEVNNARAFNPPAEKVAKTLPMSKVSLELTTQNRLTSNATRSVVQAATSSEWNVLTYLFNYRRTAGLSTSGYTPTPTGWESPTTKLRGHGAGHFVNALALAYVSGAGSDANRTAILNKITRFVNEMREIQELTFYPLDWVGKEEGETYKDVLDGGKTWKDLEVTRWREAADTWPYNAADKAANCPDWPLINLDAAQSSWDNGTLNNDPTWFGYGYINATPPLHPILNERYATYSAWVWAPYYSIHKQLAGLMDVYYTFKDNDNPDVVAVANKAFLICKDMSHWISNRLTTKCYIGITRDTTARPDFYNSTYGNLNYTWYVNISGEYGGVNESMARCAAELPDTDPDKALLLKGAEMFYNKSYWDPLAVNSEIMSLNGNSHANSRIPNFPGTLWTYNLNNNPYYYIVAKNFFDFNAGRYRYYGGNVGDGEWYRAPYTQISRIDLNNGRNNETCCATNLAKLSKDLACFDPDNAEYMDYYERLMFNQLIGSVRQAGGSWGVTYQYAIGAGAYKPFGNTNPGSSCCGGTGVENALRYTDAVYMVSDDTIWVNMMVQTKAVWDAAGYTVSQVCTWPAETSTITVTPNAGQTQKDIGMHIRIPWWATRGVSVKLNGVEVADEYLPSSFVMIPPRLWTAADSVVLTMPFQTSIDFAPDKKDTFWAGTIFLGPLAMAGINATQGVWSTQSINSDLSNITVNAPVNLADSASNTPGNNRNLYTASLGASAAGPQTNTLASVLQPDYYADGTTATGNGTTKYWRINTVTGGTGVDRADLYAAILAASALEAKAYTPASFAALEAAVGTAVGVYQNIASAQSAVDAQLALVQAAVGALVPSVDGKADLLAVIVEAMALKVAQEAWETLHKAAFDAAWADLLADPGNAAKGLAARALVEPLGDFAGRPAAPHGYARVVAQIAPAQAVYNDADATIEQVSAAFDALKALLLALRPGYMPEPEDLDALGLTALIATAKTHSASSYTPESFLVLQAVIIEAEERAEAIGVGSSTIHIADIPAALHALRTAITGLVVAPARDLGRAAVYTAAEGNIARLPEVRQITNATDARYNPLTGAGIDRTGINSNFCNDSYGVPSIQVLRLTDGNRPASGTTNGYLSWSYTDTFGVNNRLYFVLNWSQPYRIDAVRCDWWTDSNVTVPNSEARVEWLDGNTWREVTNMRDPVTNSAVTNIGTRAMGNWNAVTFDPVVTSQLRLRLHRTGTISNGIGVGEWEVFGIAGDPELRSVSVSGNNAPVVSTTNTYTAFTSDGGITGVTYKWTATGAVAIVGGDTGATVQVVANDVGAGVLSVAATHEDEEYEGGVKTVTGNFNINVANISVAVAGESTIPGGHTATYTATPNAGVLPVTYKWSLNNANARIVGSDTGNTVVVEGVAAGSVRITCEIANAEKGITATGYRDANVRMLGALDYIANTAAGRAPILPRRVVVDGMRFDVPTTSAVGNNNYNFSETFEQSLIPVVWDLNSFTAADYAADKVGTTFTVTGVTAQGSRAPGLPAKAIFTVNTALAAPVNNHRISSENVIFDDIFWAPKQIVNATATFDQAVDMLESTATNRYAVQNFKNSITRLSAVWDGAETAPTVSYNGYVFQDTDVYKTLEGFAYTLAANWNNPAFAGARDSRLAKVKEWIDLIERVQYADGYLTTAFSSRFSGSSGGEGTGYWRWRYFARHEMYNMGHFLEAAVAYTRFSVGAGLNDYTLYEIGRRVCEHISDLFGPEGYRHEIPGHAEIELAMMMFADLCDEYEGVNAGDKYRWTVAQLNWGRGRTRTNPVEQRRESTYTGGGSGGNYAQDNLPLERQVTAVGHAVRCMYYYTGATDQAIWMPETSKYAHLNNLKFPYLNTITNVYNSTSETNTYITGGLGSGESSEGFGAPYHIRSNNGYTEVCAAIAGANWYQRLGLYHEETKYADSYERALYNGVLVGVTLQGTRFAYSTRLDESTARAEWQGCACCPPNVIRTVANASGYMYTVRQDNIFVNMFGGSTGHINVQGDDIVVRQVTQYPWEGEIEMTVTPPADKTFTLNLRVPGWVKAQKYQQVTLLLDGEEIDATANAKGYISITREWPATGTVINYNIPMEIRLTEGDINVARVYSSATDRYSVLQSQWDKVVVERGPIVYTLEVASVPNGDPNVTPGITTGRAAASVRLPRDMEGFKVVNRLSGPDMVLRGVYTIEGYARYNTTTGPRDQWVQLIPYYCKTNRGGNPSSTANVTSSTTADVARLWIDATEDAVLIRGDLNRLTLGGSARLQANPKVNDSGYFEWASGTGDNTVYRAIPGATLSYEWTILEGAGVVELTSAVASRTDDAGPGKIGGVNYTFDASVATFKAIGGGAAKVQVAMKNAAGETLAVDTYDIVVIVETVEVAFVDWDGTDLGTQDVKIGEYAAAPADPARAGYHFLGWFTDDGDKWDFGNDEVTGDMTLTAKYGLHVEKAVTTPATCTAPGLRVFICSICGVELRQEIIPALGHNWGSKITVYPTFDKEGLKTFTCKRCGDKYTEAMPKLIRADANFLRGVAPDVLRYGLSEDNLWLNGKVLTLVIDGRAIVLSTSANNRNISGEVAIGDGFFLRFDLKGNGSNIKIFEVIKR